MAISGHKSEVQMRRDYRVTESNDNCSKRIPVCIMCGILPGRILIRRHAVGLLCLCGGQCLLFTSRNVYEQYDKTILG